MTPDKPLPFARPDIGQGEIDAVVDVLQSGWLTTGQRCRQFEKEFAKAVGARHAVALNSCTAALHLSLEAFAVGANDLVFMSPYTFAATAEVVRYLGATPVFVDIDPVTLNIDVESLRVSVKERLDGHAGRPRAIIPVHIAGVPCQMDKIWEVAREANLVVVEDAAHAFPAAQHGRQVGQIPSDVDGTTCFSFYATKTITTGEGGMLATDDRHIAERARTMSLHGLSRQAWSRYSESGNWMYDIVAPGYKYNLTEIAAAMGIVQLTRALEMWKRRCEIATAYTHAFNAITTVECPTVPSGSDSAWHLYLLRVNPEDGAPPRDKLIDDLRTLGVGTSVHFIPLHMHSYYRQTYGLQPQDFPIARNEFERVISLPIYSAMSDDDVSRVVEAVSSLV